MENKGNLRFYQLLETSQVANNTLTYRHVTVFAPTNRAFQKYNGSKSNLVLYHMCNGVFIDVYTDRNLVFQLVHRLTNIQPFSLNSFAEDSPEKLPTDLYDNDDSRVSRERLKKGQEGCRMRLELAGNCFERATAAGGSTVSRITIAERKRVRETTNVLYNRWKKASLDLQRLFHDRK
ncbi:fasciclin-1 isoform X1 [Vespula squamosa]|uniref:Fasciclin-1 isoform X1 n=1 Tax=Vespula squamosa TaxID=30214 RepID=A0ABD2BDH3_VESSQ